MSEPGAPTEPVAAVEPDPAPVPAGPVDAAPTRRSKTVEVAWLWLALGALGFLLLGSLLTFVGTKAADDGPDFRRVAVEGGDFRGGPGMQGGPGRGGPGMQGGPGMRGGPGFGEGEGPRFDDRDDGDEDQQDDSGDENDDDTSDTTGPREGTDTTS